jgi:hypothetical protein
MNSNTDNLTPKIHPVTREMLPDDPLDLKGVEVPGDPRLMLRLLVEEYARLGASAEEILRLGRNPFYRAFHGLYALLGEERYQAMVEEVARRYRCFRVQSVEAPVEEPVQVVQIKL